MDVACVCGVWRVVCEAMVNDIGDYGAEKIAHALKINTAVESVSLLCLWSLWRVENGAR